MLWDNVYPINDFGCLEVCEDVLDGAGDQGDGLDLGEALGEILNVGEEDVHENDLQNIFHQDNT